MKVAIDRKGEVGEVEVKRRIANLREWKLTTTPVRRLLPIRQSSTNSQTPEY